MANKEVTPKLIRIFGYPLYAIAVAALFLFLLFPSQAMESYAARRFNQAIPFLSLSLTGLRPTLSGLAVARAGIFLSAFEDRPVFEAEKIRIRLRIHGLARDRWRLELDGMTAKGEIFGSCHRNDAVVRVKLQVEGGKIQVPKPILGFKQVVVRRAHVDMAAEGQTIRILGLDLLSEKGAASFAGSIFLEKRKPDHSRLDLKGSVAGVRNGLILKNKMGVSVTGSVAKPKIRLTGVLRSSS